jgi:4-hydroxybenzoate polyprenyltransferase
VYEWLIYGNFFIAAAAAALSLQTEIVLGAPVRLDPLTGLVFFATLLIYGLDRLVTRATEDRVDMSPRHRWIEARRGRLTALTAAGLVGTGVLALLMPLRIFVALGALGGASLMYALPLVPTPRGWRRAKSLPGLKIFLIAVVWATVTVTLPALDHRAELLGSTHLLSWTERALFIFAITLPFDVRDMERDRRADIVTLPHLLGVGGTRALALALCVGFAALSLAQHGIDTTGIAKLATIAVVAALLTGLDPSRRESYYGLAFDGTIFVQFALVALAA